MCKSIFQQYSEREHDSGILNSQISKEYPRTGSFFAKKMMLEVLNYSLMLIGEVQRVIGGQSLDIAHMYGEI